MSDIRFGGTAVGFCRPVKLEPLTTPYKQLHAYMRRTYPPVRRCEWCAGQRRTHLAIARNDGYTTNRADWLELCVRCHTYFDGRLNARPMRGEHNGRAKLCEADVKEIRTLYAAHAYSQPQLAERFGVTHILIGKVVRRELWKEVV